MASKRLIRRVVLERASRPLLARFLETHARAFFEANGLSVAALAASPTRDRSLVYRVFDLLHDRALALSLPRAFRALLQTFDALATPGGGEAILRADVKGLLPRATYGDEDLALLMLLDHPELAIEARREADADEVQSFTEYEPAEPRQLHFGEGEIVALEQVFGAKLEARDRTRLCKVHSRREGANVSLEIVHARRPRTFDKVDAKSLELDQSTDIHTERAFVEVELDTGKVAIHAARGIKELVREALGEVLGSGLAHFRPTRVYDLSPFAHLPEALSTVGTSSRLLRVELHAIHVATPNGKTVIGFVRSRKDLLLDDEAKEALAAALRSGPPVAVKLYLFIGGRSHPLCLEMSTKGGKNVVDFDRSDPEVGEIVRAYLRARGVLREVAPETSYLPAQLVVPFQASMQAAP